jgi:hypothetical protein
MEPSCNPHQLGAANSVCGVRLDEHHALTLTVSSCGMQAAAAEGGQQAGFVFPADKFLQKTAIL